MLAITQEISKKAEEATKKDAPKEHSTQNNHSTEDNPKDFSWPPSLFTNTPNHVLTLMKQLSPYPPQGRKEENNIIPELFPLDDFLKDRFTQASKTWEKKYEEENHYLDIILKDKKPKIPNKKTDKDLTHTEGQLKAMKWIFDVHKLCNSLPYSQNEEEDISKIREYIENAEKIINANRYINIYQPIFSLKLKAFQKNITFENYLEDFKAAAKKPQDNDILNLYGTFLFYYGSYYTKKHDNEKAIEKYKLACKKYKQATEFDKNQPHIWTNWGRTLYQLGNIAKELRRNKDAQKYYQEACEKYNKSTDLDKNQRQTWTNWGLTLSDLGDIAKNLGNHQEALKYYQQALEKAKEALKVEKAKENPDQEFIKDLEHIIQQLTVLIEQHSSPPKPSS